MKKIVFGLACLLPCSSLFAAWSVDSKKSDLSFLAVGTPGFMKIRGEKAILEGKVDIKEGKLGGQFEVKLDSFFTGIELRDKHMKEKHFETAKFPNSSLVLDDMPVPPLDKEVEFSGRLTLKGVQKPIRGVLTLSKSDPKTLQGEANFTIKLAEFPELGVPKYLGITIAEDVRVNVSVVAEHAD